MTEPITPVRMKPVIVLPPGTMSKKDIAKLNDNHFVVVECKEPALVRFIEPPPNGYSVQEKAGLALCRVLFSRAKWNDTYDRNKLTSMFVEILLESTPLGKMAPDPVAPAKK